MKTTNEIKSHSFHIPVMGIAYTIDSPIRVAQYGISSVISLVDDILIEKMREFYSNEFNFPFHSITDKIEDFRAKRITAYLNMLEDIVKQKLEILKESVLEQGTELMKYIDMLPDSSPIKSNFIALDISNANPKSMLDWAKSNLIPGSIDVNIMTKLDKETYHKNEKLPSEYNDAHSALRGFANSKLQSSVVLSAGMNPRLYSYLENFKDFFPNEKGELKKKIIIKVSDYRSALIQGKFFAKKGLWVSEYRVESGLNCGGHTFATEGYLLGPVLEEFKKNKEQLKGEIFEMLTQALASKGHIIPVKMPILKITAQGGVGTAQEHDFLIKHYNLDSVGWGTPFLLVPEAVNIDKQTQQLLSNAKEDDLYLSNISPLGVPFNNVKNNTQDLIKQNRIDDKRPGSPCVKKFASLNKEFTEKVICTASRQYQELKINELKSKSLPNEEYTKEYNRIVEKACICVGLGTSAMISSGMDTKVVGPGVSVCPGPNMAYFSKISSLKNMVDHIYGKENVISESDRPNMFIKELKMYIDHFKIKISESTKPLTSRQVAQLAKFKENLVDGIEYYRQTFANFFNELDTQNPQSDLNYLEKELNLIERK
jgi:hypothetical protein